MALVTFVSASVPQAGASAAATTTALTILSGGKTTASVTSGSVVTLTAAVFAGSTKVTTGQVNFCDTAVSYCTDIHLLGTAQLTSAGTATLVFRPKSGSQTYKAAFAGTRTDAASTSATAALSVTGGVVTFTQIAQTGDPGAYTLTATVGGVGGSALTGDVSFLDSSDADAVLATAPLVAVTPATTFLSAGVVAGGPNYVQTLNALAFGDLNGDGIPDMVVANGSAADPGDNTLTILLGNGDGTFTATASSPGTGGSVPEGLALGDFNGDGKLDIAVSNGVSNTVTLLLGNGDGTFTIAPKSVATGIGPSVLAAGDFNGDGLLDLAVTNFTANTVTILLGKGDGTFTATPASPQTAANPASLVAGDFNGDGKLDLVVGGATMTVLLGNGDGTFTTAATTSQAANLPQGIAVGDFNGDGKLDLAVSSTNANNDIALLLGKGDGTFTASTIATDIGTLPEAGLGQILSGDFNGDGHLDLVFVNDSEGGIFAYLMLGNGDGTFQSAIYTGASALINSDVWLSADLNGDGVPDLATLNGESGGDQVNEFLAANQSATATAASVAVPPGSGTNQVVASYPGDSNYEKSVSAAIALTAGPGASSVALTASPNPATQGASVTLTGTVTGGSVTPTGTMIFADASGQLGTGTLNGSGAATFSESALPMGSYSITAAYSGDANYTASTSPAVTLTITAAAVVVAIPAPPAVTPGASAAATATFTASSTYAGTLNLTCSLTTSPAGAQSPPTCSLAPTSLALKAGATGTSALTVTTTAASSTASFVQPTRKSLWGLGAGGAAFAVLLMCGIPTRRRRWMSMLILLGLVVASAVIGCGGGGGGKGPGTPATTAGNYTLTVTATDAANATITTSTTVAVTVN